MNWEIGIDIYTLICIKQITNENLLYSTGNSTSLYSRNKHNIVKQQYPNKRKRTTLNPHKTPEK